MAANKSIARTSNGVSFFSTVLIILLPKCPLCITAYMGAILLFFDIDYGQLAPFLLHAKPVLGALIVAMILLNYKGRKTVISAGIATVAGVFIILKSYFYIDTLDDWILYVAFIFAIWYNGNFMHFFRFIKTRATA
jgi:hypothetical protein